MTLKMHSVNDKMNKVNDDGFGRINVELRIMNCEL